MNLPIVDLEYGEAGVGGELLLLLLRRVRMLKISKNKKYDYWNCRTKSGRFGSTFVFNYKPSSPGLYNIKYSFFYQISLFLLLAFFSPSFLPFEPDNYTRLLSWNVYFVVRV
jgi:hypothetical protein